MTSRRVGFDRQTFNKEDFDAMPFPDFESLPPRSKDSVEGLAHRLEHDFSKRWEDLDAFLFELYGLDEEARQTIHDTLFSAAAYRRQGAEAFKRTHRDHRHPFQEELQDLLEPFSRSVAGSCRSSSRRHSPTRGASPGTF